MLHLLLESFVYTVHQNVWVTMSWGKHSFNFREKRSPEHLNLLLVKCTIEFSCISVK